MAQQMLEQFHAAHPNIRVFYTPDPDNLDEQMMADFQAGTAPDVLPGLLRLLPRLGAEGLPAGSAAVCGGRPGPASTIDDWDRPQYRALFTRSGVQFGLPKYHGALALYYNKDLFDRYGVDYPDGSWNHDDYLQAMRRFVKGRDGDGKTDLWGSMVDVSWDRIQVHVNGWGGHFVDPENPTRSLMARPEALEAHGVDARPDVGRPHHGQPLDVQNLETRQAFIQQRWPWSRTAPGRSRTSWRTRRSASAWRPSRPGRRAG